MKMTLQEIRIIAGEAGILLHIFVEIYSVSAETIISDAFS
jgi:hypothetical protein